MITTSLKDQERIDDLGRNGYKIIQNKEKFCFGIDAVLLSDFAKAKPGERVLDILYALFSGSAVFLYVLAAPGGRLGVWELLFTLCGFLSYLHLPLM